jgi:hypothetical protein
VTTTKKTPKKTRKKRGGPILSRKLKAVTVAEFAKGVGIHHSSVAHNQKIIRDEAGNVDLVATYQEFASIEEARKGKEQLDCDIRRVKLERLRGELVPVKEVKTKGNEILKGLHSAFQASNRNLAPQLAAISDPKQIVRMLDQDQTRAIEECKQAMVNSEIA